MALKTNLEAAREIARQSRLRDLSGLLVLDFIDLSETKNRKILERSLWEYFSKDKARIQTAPISTFGLLEVSRQRLRPSFLEMNSNICSHCSGKGIVRADESNAMLILRTIENEIFNGKYDVVNVFGIASSIIYLLNHKREEISFIESKYSIKLSFSIDRDATSDSYSIEKIKLSDKNRNSTAQYSPALQDTSEIYNEPEEKSHTKNRRKIDKNKGASGKKSQEPSENSENNPEKVDQKSTNSEKTKQISNTKKKRTSKHKKKITKKDADKATQVKEKTVSDENTAESGAS